jgi:hypothetical protein
MSFLGFLNETRASFLVQVRSSVGILRRGLRAVPAVLVDQEDVLGLGQELHLAHAVGPHARVVALEDDPLATPRIGIEAHAHVDVANVGIDGDELRAGIGIRLARLPGRRRRRRHVVVLEQHHAVRVGEAHERAVAVGDLLGPGLHGPGVGDLHGAPQGSLGAADRERRDDGVDLRLLAAAARGEKGGAQERDGGPGPPCTSKLHLDLLAA